MTEHVDTLALSSSAWLERASGLAVRLRREFEDAAASMGTGGFSAAVRAAMVVALRDSWRSKKLLGRRLAGFAGRVLVGVGSSAARVSEDGVETEVRRVTAAARAGLSNGAIRVRTGLRAARSAGSAQRAYGLATLISAWLAFFLTAGGADLEGGAPDLDLLTGVGNHRNPFTHSLLLGLTIEVFLRFCAALAQQMAGHLPEGHHPVWDAVVGFSDAAARGGIIGMYLGLAAHLAADANVLAVATKPYVGLPVELPMAAHQAGFAANSAAAAFSAVAAIAERSEEQPR